MRAFDNIDSALQALKQGRFIVVVDDVDRENEGDLLMAAEKVTPDSINFMATYARGLICLAATSKRLDDLQIGPIARNNTTRHGTAFMEPIDVHAGTSTGISAFDRAKTVNWFVDAAAKADDFERPGHIFPLRAVEGGVLKRAGHTEATVDFCRLAGLKPAGVICEIMSEDGSMARVPELLEFAEHHQLPIVTVADLIRYRRQNERLINKVTMVKLPTCYGDFEVHAFESRVDSNPYVALVMGNVHTDEPVLVRVHSSCLTGDVLSSLRCDCGSQLHNALSMIAEEGRGVLLYIEQEGRGIGLLNKLRAYELQQNQGMDTVEANIELGFRPDERDYGIGAQVLVDLGIRQIRLMSNNPTKRVGLQAYGLEISEVVPLVVAPNYYNEFYLQTKKRKMGHDLPDNIFRVKEEE